MNAQKFARIAESLRQYRRAELRDFEEELGARPVDTLYVDPLPDNAVLMSVLSSNSTFLLGRKGTGKSTIFAKAQSDIRKRKDLLSAYIDVKSLYDIINATDTPTQALDSVEVDAGIYRAHMLRKAFLGSVIAELLKEIEGLCNTMSLWDQWIGKKKTFAELRTGLGKLQAQAKESKLVEHELPILRQVTRKWKSRRKTEHSGEQGIGLKGSLGGHSAKLSGTASIADFDKSLDDKELYNEYSDVVSSVPTFVSSMNETR